MLYNETVYLQSNADVAHAVKQGLIDALTHFEQFGRLENRVASHVFDPGYYLASNPDVAAALAQNPGFSAYDHFEQFGISENRAPFAAFDSAFYLNNSPDVAQAAQLYGISPVEHFLNYGVNEVRALGPFLDLNAYLFDNPDVAAAINQHGGSAFDHLMSYGIYEGRSLGNGISLNQFANDPVFQQALSETGNPFDALTRLAEVTPFLPGFIVPTGWSIPANTPLPIDFVPVEGEYLVLPKNITLPDDFNLPDAFVPDDPSPSPSPHPLPDSGINVELSNGVNALVGTPYNDHFWGQASQLKKGDSIDGKGGYDTLTLSGAGVNQIKDVTLKNIEAIQFSRNQNDVTEDGAAINASVFNTVATLWQHGYAGDITGLRQGQAAGFTAIENSGSENSIKVAYNNDVTSASLIAFNIANDAYFSLSGTQLNNLNLYASIQAEEDKDETITLTSLPKLKSLVLTLSSDAIIKLPENVFSTLETMNASASVGDIQLYFPKEKVALTTYYGSQGDDQIYLSLKALTQDKVTLNGGAGDDEFIIDLGSGDATARLFIEGGSGKNSYAFEGGNIRSSNSSLFEESVTIHKFSTSDTLYLKKLDGLLNMETTQEIIDSLNNASLPNIIAALNEELEKDDSPVDTAYFHFGDDTFVYQNLQNEGLDGDMLIRLTGQVNLSENSIKAWPDMVDALPD